MQRAKRARAVAISAGLAAVLIWSSSYVIVKLALPYIGPVTLSGLRYFVGAVLLLSVMQALGSQHGQSSTLSEIRSISPDLWKRLLIIGLFMFTIGNGIVFFSLNILPATTVSFLLTLLPIFVLIGGIIWLNEHPGGWQIGGVFVCIAGCTLFFVQDLGGTNFIGVALVVGSLIVMAISWIMLRGLARDMTLNTTLRASLPLLFGGAFLALIGIMIEGTPQFSYALLLTLLLLSLVHTAFGYYCYNYALITLTVVEMGVLLNLLPLGTAFIAWWLLGEKLSTLQIGGIIVVIIGVTLVQLKPARSRNHRPAVKHGG